MKCRTIVQFVSVGICVALVVLFCFLTRFDAIVGGANLMAFYNASEATLLAPDSYIGILPWVIAMGAIFTTIAMFSSPHRTSGKIADRIALLFAIANLLGASWLLFASYAGGDSPDLSWVAFLALVLMWVVNIVIVERADLGMSWSSGPIIWLYRVATDRDGYGDSDSSVEMGTTRTATRNRYKSVRKSRKDDDEDDEEDNGGCARLVDFDSQPATELRVGYSNGARIVHFLFIEVPIGATFGAVSTLMFAALAQMIDHFSADSVSLASSVLLAIFALVIPLVYSLGRGLHPYAIGAFVVTFFQYIKQTESPGVLPLVNASLATLVILGLAVAVVSVLRVAHFIRKYRG